MCTDKAGESNEQVELSELPLPPDVQAPLGPDPTDNAPQYYYYNVSPYPDSQNFTFFLVYTYIVQMKDLEGLSSLTWSYKSESTYYIFVTCSHQ